MMARNRRFGRNRSAVLKTGAGIATAAVLGGGAIAIAAMSSGGHSAGIAAAPAAHTTRFANEGTMLAAALADWNSSKQGSYSQLAQMTSARGFSQTSHQGKTLDIQRGIVVLATKQFIILQSANGDLHLWLISGATKHLFEERIGRRRVENAIIAPLSLSGPLLTVRRFDQELPVPEDWSILVEKATRLPEQLQTPTRQQQMAQQQQAIDSDGIHYLDRIKDSAF